MSFETTIAGWGNYPRQEAQILSPSSFASIREAIAGSWSNSTWHGSQLR